MLMLQVAFVWFAIGISAIALGWLVAAIVRPRFPEWWERHISTEVGPTRW